MFTALASSPQVRLSSLTNTQGLPHNRLTYIAFAELKACMSLLLNIALSGVRYAGGTVAIYGLHWH